MRLLSYIVLHYNMRTGELLASEKKLKVLLKCQLLAETVAQVTFFDCYESLLASDFIISALTDAISFCWSVTATKH